MEKWREDWVARVAEFGRHIGCKVALQIIPASAGDAMFAAGDRADMQARDGHRRVAKKHRDGRKERHLSGLRRLRCYALSRRCLWLYHRRRRRGPGPGTNAIVSPFCERCLKKDEAELMAGFRETLRETLGADLVREH
jgi:hypothetical protein